MTNEPNNTPVYSADTREPTTPVTARIPVSLARMVDAVQSKDRDTFRNDTIRKALESYVTARLAA